MERQHAGEPTPERMREVLGAFATGVVVVTALAGEPIGFTCQSFVSQSLDPPLISFSAARTSTTWPQIRPTGRFCVNVLAHDQHELSELFARLGADRFAGVSWRPSPLGAPILGGVSAWIDCELAAEHDAGDHTIVLGAVRDLAADPSRYPLIYYRSRYAPSEHWRAWPEI
ncbi:MAG: 3-hydroxy-9,10-secoandrosta,3,5(10)-triene-9,17-dione monooxygenase reductase component [Pseudonocardiales bacterium]|nr:3-hydroxy-9,10-secoandrosta,3,5(10)-triene-9,17-dione monooxygenase reductase component [Pseudonocardiales bacterium]MDT4942046.1 3-hydroxy-9,10-secoandrosta,3,5(10)-triene-9,17-dione monooxygenase reductase component [Pseudonocardiales bacterium]